MKSLFLIAFLFLPIFIHQSNAQTNTSITLNEIKNYQALYPDSALAEFNHIYIQTKDSNTYLASIALKGVGVCYYYLSEHDSAIMYFKKALRFSMMKGPPVNATEKTIFITSILQNLALTYEIIGDNTTAQKIHLQALQIRKAVHDEQGMALFTFTSLGIIAFKEGAYDQSIEHFFNALGIFLKYNDLPNAANSLDQIAAVHYEQKDFVSAERFYQAALKIRLKQYDPIQLAKSYNNLGINAMAAGDTLKALELFRSSLSLKMESNDISGLASVHNNMGMAFQTMGPPDSALHHYMMAKKLSIENGDIPNEIVTSINAASLYIDLKQFDLAEKLLQFSLHKAREFGFRNLEKDASSQLANLFSSTADFRNAFLMKSLEKELSDSLMNMESIRRTASAETRFKYEMQLASDSVAHQQRLANREVVYRESMRRQQQIMWFIVIAAILGIAVLYFFYRSRQLKLRNREKTLLLDAAERENILLRSQMNPHFIFNAMNSVQAFISENDSFSASRHLSKFASLIRHILENSALESIPLSDEVQALSWYMELEQARFKNRFTWELLTDEELDDETIMVPPLILQPFAENAILHGVLNRENNGAIRIEIFSKHADGSLLLTISDNGPGIHHTASKKVMVPGKKKSLGMNITRERIVRAGGSLQIEELKDTAGEIVGTKVCIHLPIVSE